MSDFVQALLISGGIFTVVVLTQYGTHALTAKAIIRPLLMVAGVGYFYLKDAPTDATSLRVYAVGAAVGLVFAGIAAAVTRVVRTSDGNLATRCGLGFVAIWLIAVVARLGFVWSVENVASFHNWFGVQMITHHISVDTVAPFFVIWALTMVLGRTLIIQARTRLTAPVHTPAAIAPQVTAVS
ncbi:hypothetical protein [Williamsia sterculiae]|uniref:DUF1453 domain-containing protein n=1 Tax=Williamsia sterculiae TaxID=1344003 RepID=A0A1N7F515_9NOCA|nr:hypothetical protein [Williamsia sterculiae]SIR95376.1 hypothetical protein SAMN05445060_1807 [Williamsia sterculiae]